MVFLNNEKNRGKYSLGVRFLDFNGMVKGESTSGTSAISYLFELSRLINESIYLEVWYGSNILFSKAFDYSTESSKGVPYDWRSLPLHCTCKGKIILSNMSDEDFNRYFNNQHLAKLMPNTIVDIDLMRKAIELIKRENIAYELEECVKDINGVAVGIKNNEGETMGALFIIGPAVRLTKEVISKMALSIRICASKISSEMGFQAKDFRKTASLRDY